jgi:UV DNA damage endonuclease
MNCSKGNITDISDRFIKACGMLPASVLNRLVIENEDKGIWTVENLYKHVYLKTGVPITFDYLHHKCNPGNLTEKEAFDLCVETWKSNIPLFHYAESAPGKNPRAHADMPTNIFDTYNTYVDVDMEFKHKDLAIEAYESLVRK